MKSDSCDELKLYQKQYGIDHSIGDLTPTFCRCAGVRFPLSCTAKPISSVTDRAEEIFSGEALEKILIYNPDAVGDFLFQRYPEDFEGLVNNTDFKVLSTSVMQSVTPVCFATMFSGASPEVHGIRTYEKPVLKVETLFDVFAEAGKKIVIVSSCECSIDKIFRQRNVDYFSFQDYRDILKYTKLLIADCDYDLIVCYNGCYDESLHHTGPCSESSLLEMRRAIRDYLELNCLTDRHWSSFHRASVFAPDHGGHPVKDGEFGTHGDNLREDMVVNHFYRLRTGNRS